MPETEHVSLSSENATILSNLKEFFLGRSVPAYLVGGCIRDSLRGLPTRDIDVAILGDSHSLARELADVLGGAFVLIGQARRVARVVVPSQGDGGWVIDVSSIEGSGYDDLKKRDFTVDAMALTLEDWGTLGWEERVLDPFGARIDLAQGTIRAIGPSVFLDDPVRLLRAVRLAAKLGFDIESGTARLISQNAHLISSTAAERVRDELLTILSLERAKVHLELLDELGLLCCIIPELGITKGVEQPKEHYWDVFGHSLHSVEGVERVTSGNEEDPVSDLVPWSLEMEGRYAQERSDGHTWRTFLKLGALLHDVAKPQSKMVDAQGRTRFLGHHTLGASMSGEILHRLRVSNRGAEMVCGLVEYHLRPMQMSQGAELPTARAIYRYFSDVGDVATDTLYLSLADHLAARGPDLDMGAWQHHVRIVTHILEVGSQGQAPEKMPRLITGHDLIGEFGLAPGPLIGVLLESAREAQAAGELDTREGALAWVRCRLEGATDEGSRPEDNCQLGEVGA